MENEFTEARIKKTLTQYQRQLVELHENENDLSDLDLSAQVERIVRELQQERDRADRNRSHILEETNYIPALDEALKFLSQALEVAGTTEFESKLYDAEFSLGYHLNH